MARKLKIPSNHRRKVGGIKSRQAKRRRRKIHRK